MRFIRMSDWFMKGDDMRFEEMKAKADEFFEFPTANKDHVTTTSAVLFAMAAFKEGVETVGMLPHRMMFDDGVLLGKAGGMEDAAKISERMEIDHFNAVGLPYVMKPNTPIAAAIRKAASAKEEV